MTTVRVTCGDCERDYDLEPGYLRALRPIQEYLINRAYTFRCPVCHKQHVNTVSKDTYALILAGGVPEVIHPAPSVRQANRWRAKINDQNVATFVDLTEDDEKWWTTLEREGMVPS